MPGSIIAASPTLVLPQTLSTAWVRRSDRPLVYVEYPDGHCERASATAASRKSWELRKALSASQLTTLLNFIESVRGPLDPFYFYDGTDTAAKWTWDPTGVSITGRYIAIFNFSSLPVSHDLGHRYTIPISMEEVA